MNIQKMVKLISVNVAVYLVSISAAYAFTCKDSSGKVLKYNGAERTSNVSVNLTPQLQEGQNLVVDLSQSIQCKNDDPTARNDYVSMDSGSIYNNALSNFKGSLVYYNTPYEFPLSGPTKQYNFTSGFYNGWNTQLYLTPISSAAGGVLINQGTHFATLVMKQVGTDKNGGGNIQQLAFTWYLYANNSVVIPVGTCDVSSRAVSVTLPEYSDSEIDKSVSVPLSIHCTKARNITFFLSGTTDSGSTIFANTASGNTPAKGVGIQLVRNGNPIEVNTPVKLGSVDTSEATLGLSARYARTQGRITAGAVQSVIGVTFVYD